MGPTSDVRSEESLSADGRPAGTGFSGRLRRAWETERGRRVIFYVVILVVVLIVFVGGAVMFSSLRSESQSYKDGYSSGGTAFTADTAQEGAQQACQAIQFHSPAAGGIPRGDDATQWLQGCISAFNNAQGDN